MGTQNLIEYHIGSGQMDVSGTVPLVIPVADGGTLVKVITAISVALTTADAVLTVTVDGTAQTDTITVTQSGSAVGDIDSQTYGAAVGKDGYVQIASNGGPGAGNIGVTFVIRR